MFKLVLEKAEESSRKNMNSYFIDCAKAFGCVDHNKLWKILKENGIPDQLACLLRSLYMGKEATLRTELQKTDCIQIGKGVCQVSTLSSYLFNLSAEDIMQNIKLD